MTRNNGTKKQAAAFPLYYYVPCRVEPGMFRGEWLVFMNAVNPDDPNEPIPVQLLVDEREVRDIHGTPQRHRPVEAWLRVSVLDKRKGFVRVVLPQPGEPVGHRTYVEANSVRAETGA